MAVACRGGSSHSRLQMASENQSRPHRLGSAFTCACAHARTHGHVLQWVGVTVLLLLICLCVAEMQPAITQTEAGVRDSLAPPTESSVTRP